MGLAGLDCVVEEVVAERVSILRVVQDRPLTVELDVVVGDGSRGSVLLGQLQSPTTSENAVGFPFHNGCTVSSPRPPTVDPGLAFAFG